MYGISICLFFSAPSATLAVPVVETSPSGKVRYYVREYGPVTSEAEPVRSRSSSRRSRHRSRDRHRHSVAAAVSFDRVAILFNNTVVFDAGKTTPLI